MWEELLGPLDFLFSVLPPTGIGQCHSDGVSLGSIEDASFCADSFLCIIYPESNLWVSITSLIKGTGYLPELQSPLRGDL